MTNRIPLAVALAAFAVAPIVACGGDKPQPKMEDTAKATTTASTSRLPDKAPDSPTASAVRISDEIVKACGISAPDAFFAFDSAHIRQEDARVLDQVATCFSSGPLKGRTVKLVGHADPRGSSDYNVTLGQSRADGVAGYIVSRGLDKAKTESSSRGAMDATGDNEPTWARDRRVDVML
ncbi:MAG: OmpA family protein, partial [Polyangiaceae bacterium]